MADLFAGLRVDPRTVLVLWAQPAPLRTGTLHGTGRRRIEHARARRLVSWRRRDRRRRGLPARVVRGYLFCAPARSST